MTMTLERENEVVLTFLGAFLTRAYFVSIPSKLISEDVHTAWLCYSANFSYARKDPRFNENPEGSSYSMSLKEIRFLNGAAYKKQ